MKIGLHSITYAGFFYEGGALRIEEVVERAQRYAYDEVEVMAKRPISSPFDFDSRRARELRQYAESKGIEFCMVAGYIDLPRTDVLDREKELTFARETFRLAGDLGSPSVRVYAGGEHLREGLTAWEHWELCVEGLKELVPVAEAYAVDIALEWHVGAVQSTDALLDMVEQVGSERVKVVLDPPHLSIRGESAKDAVEKAGDLLVHSHIADFVRGTPLVSYEAVPQLALKELLPLNHCPLGEGCVEIEPFIRALKERGFKGTISFEVCTPFHIRHRKPTLEDVDALVEQAVEYLRGLL